MRLNTFDELKGKLIEELMDITKAYVIEVMEQKDNYEITNIFSDNDYLDINLNQYCMESEILDDIIDNNKDCYIILKTKNEKDTISLANIKIERVNNEDDKSTDYNIVQFSILTDGKNSEVKTFNFDEKIYTNILLYTKQSFMAVLKNNLLKNNK